MTEQVNQLMNEDESADEELFGSAYARKAGNMGVPAADYRGRPPGTLVTCARYHLASIYNAHLEINATMIPNYFTFALWRT